LSILAGYFRIGQVKYTQFGQFKLAAEASIPAKQGIKNLLGNSVGAKENVKQ
jgi:hypothetical protein